MKKIGRLLRRCMAALMLIAAAAHAQSLTTLHEFTLAPDASLPEGPLLAVGGMLYGASFTGGAYDRGSVYSVDPVTGVEKVIYSFKKSQDGAYPRGGLDHRGAMLYGTTTGGGSAPETSGKGTIFAIDLTTGAEAWLYSFPASGGDGAYPIGALILQSGRLYGVTQQGGDVSCACGAVFAYDLRTHTETVLHRFVGGQDGGSPFGGLTALNGLLYGATAGGGASGDGTIFSQDPSSGAETVLYSFKGSNADGESPLSPLIYANGLFYGTTQIGGGTFEGTVFSFDPTTNIESTLYSFQGGADGASPEAGLIYRHHHLYGTTRAGGAGSVGDGVIFKLDPATGAETVLHVFTGPDGSDPTSHLTSLKGALYGVTFTGGVDCRKEGCGTVFKLTQSP